MKFSCCKFLGQNSFYSLHVAALKKHLSFLLSVMHKQSAPNNASMSIEIQNAGLAEMFGFCDMHISHCGLSFSFEMLIKVLLKNSCNQLKYTAKQFAETAERFPCCFDDHYWILLLSPSGAGINVTA